MSPLTFRRDKKRIYTVTFSPAIDYYVGCDGFSMGTVNRADSEIIHVGGKGVNVSVMLKNLGIDSVILGCVAGFTGEAISSMIRKYGVNSDLVRVDGTSRINLKMNTNGVESELNGQGPVISKEVVGKIIDKILKAEDGSTIVLAGALPKGMPQDTYSRILEAIKGKDLRIVLDTSREKLLKALIYRPFFVKPNLAELNDFFHVSVSADDIPSVFSYAKKLKDMGAQNVIVSLGAKGACMLSSDGKKYYIPAPEGKLVSSVGSGDSLVAGFIAGLEFFDGDYLSAFRLGVAAGSATAFTGWIAGKDDVMALYDWLNDRIVAYGAEQ